MIFWRTFWVALVSLLVNFLPAATFLSPGGTIIGGRGVSDRGSTYALSWMSFGVPLKAGGGSFSSSGTRLPVLPASFFASSAQAIWVVSDPTAASVTRRRGTQFKKNSLGNDFIGDRDICRERRLD